MEFKLRPWSYNDLESVAQCANNPNITQFMSDGFPKNSEQWSTFLEFAINSKSILYLAIEVQGKAIGGIGVSCNKAFDYIIADLGYWLSEEYWGMGIITKAIKEIVVRAFETFDITQICAKPYSHNFASHHILQKAGFTLITRNLKAVVKDGELLDELVFTINRNEIAFINGKISKTI
jgi:RimJ/RimL family protein N-acetyltransferase